jgi:hypothetical protein
MADMESFSTVHKPKAPEATMPEDKPDAGSLSDPTKSWMQGKRYQQAFEDNRLATQKGTLKIILGRKNPKQNVGPDVLGMWGAKNPERTQATNLHSVQNNLVIAATTYSPTKPQNPQRRRKSPMKKRVTAISSHQLNNRVWKFKRKQIQLSWMKYFYVALVAEWFTTRTKFSYAASIIQRQLRYRTQVKFSVFSSTSGIFHIRKAIRLKKINIHANRVAAFVRVHNNILAATHPDLSRGEYTVKAAVYHYRRKIIRVQRHVRCLWICTSHRIKYLIAKWEHIREQHHEEISVKLKSMERERVKELSKQRAGNVGDAVVVMSMFDSSANSLHHVRPATRARIEAKQRTKRAEEYREVKKEEQLAADRGEQPKRVHQRARRAEEGLDRKGLNQLRLLHDWKDRLKFDTAHNDQRLMLQASRRIYKTMKHSAEQKMMKASEVRTHDFWQPALPAPIRLKLAMCATRQAIKELRLSDSVIEAMGGVSLRFTEMVKSLEPETVYERIRNFRVQHWLSNRMKEHAGELGERLTAFHGKPKEISVADMRHVKTGFRRLSGLLQQREHPDLLVYIYSRVDKEEWATLITQAISETHNFMRLLNEMTVAEKRSEPIAKKTKYLAKRFLERYQWPQGSKLDLKALRLPQKKSRGKEPFSSRA